MRLPTIILYSFIAWLMWFLVLHSLVTWIYVVYEGGVFCPFFFYGDEYVIEREHIMILVVLTVISALLLTEGLLSMTFFGQILIQWAFWLCLWLSV